MNLLLNRSAGGALANVREIVDPPPSGTQGVLTADRTAIPCRVVHMTSVHHPFDTRIFHKECRTLVLAGYDVALIAPYAEGDGVEDGIRLRSVPPPRDRGERLTRTILNVYRAAVREDADIYHFHDPELMGVGVLLKLQGKKVIYDVHEDYSGTMDAKQWIPSGLRVPAVIAARVCEAAFSCTYDRVIAATPKILKKFRPGTAHIVQNFPWINELCCTGGLPYEKREPLVVYVGAVADIRGLREMRQALELASQRAPVKLVIAGRMRAGVKIESVDSRQSGLIEHTGALSRPQVAQLLARARVGIVTLHPTGNYVDAQPTKLFEYMSAGLPVVASDFPIWREIVMAARCGLLVDPLDPAAIAEALLWLLAHPSDAAEMGRNGRRAVTEHYNWERESERLIAVYCELRHNN